MEFIWKDIHDKNRFHVGTQSSSGEEVYVCASFHCDEFSDLFSVTSISDNEAAEVYRRVGESQPGEKIPIEINIKLL